MEPNPTGGALGIQCKAHASKSHSHPRAVGAGVLDPPTPSRGGVLLVGQDFSSPSNWPFGEAEGSHQIEYLRRRAEQLLAGRILAVCTEMWGPKKDMVKAPTAVARAVRQRGHHVKRPTGDSKLGVLKQQREG